MSTEPTGLNGKCVNVLKKKYLSVSFERSDWCDFKGNCLITNLIEERDEICFLCKYRKQLNVPLILNRLYKERNR